MIIRVRHNGCAFINSEAAVLLYAGILDHYILLIP